MTPSAQLAMIAEFPPIRFAGFNAFKAKISEQRDILDCELKGQYLSFDHVSEGQFENIDRRRPEVGRGLRFAYYPDISTLIVKIPTGPHESAGLSLGQAISRGATMMNLTLSDFYPLGATTYTGKGNSKKEGDSAWKNLQLRPQQDSWPMLVIETGVSESLPRVQADAKWWIESSAGNVNIVIIIHVHVASKFIQIQKYKPRAPHMNLRSGPNYVARKVWETSINCSVNPPVISHVPLIFEFVKVFGRAPQLPQEQDVILNRQDLAAWARMIFTGLP